MLGEVIQEYLVSLGVQLDKPGFSEFESTLNKATSTVEKSTGSWAKNFLTAQTIVVSALAGITAASLGLIKSAAAQDLEMEKLSRRMMISKDVAWSYKKAIDALGESVSDIQMNPELMDKYQRLIRDGNNMKPGGDYTDTMKQIREMMFEFTRLKQEVSYALNWVGYYLAKYLSGPLGDAYKKLRAFNDMFITNMSSWAEKLARALVYIINVGIHFFDLLKNIGKSLGSMWDSFPKGVKIAVASLGILAVALKTGPIGVLTTLIGGLLLLIDDYFGYMEGKEAAFGSYWDKLNDLLVTLKTGIDEIMPVIIGYMSDFSDYCEKSWKWLGDLVKRFLSWLNSSEEVKSFIKVIGELLTNFIELGKAIWKLATTILGALFEGLSDRRGSDSFIKALKEMAKFVSDLIKAITKLFKMASENKSFIDFWKTVGKVISTVITQAIYSVGKLGRALLALVQGDFKGAAALAGQAFSKVASESSGELGTLSEEYEGSPGAYSRGSGGSYGSWQIIAANMPDFLENYLKPANNRWYKRLTDSGPVGSDGFTNEWQNIAIEDAEGFRAIQKAYIKATHYDEQVNKILSETGMDINQQSRGVKEAVWSTAVQQGPGTSVVTQAINSLGGASNISMSETDQKKLLDAIYNIRGKYTANDEGVSESVLLRRYENELNDAKGMVTQEANEWAQHEKKIREDNAIKAGSGSVWDVVKAQAGSLYDSTLLPSGASKIPSNSFAGANNITYNVKVGDVNVAQTNASPDEIGDAVADKSMQKLKENGNYILQNRTMGGGNLL